jgi:hypothetical protein
MGCFTTRMLNLLWIRHSQAHLRMLFHNTSPLGGQAQPQCFSHFKRERRASSEQRREQDAGPFA